MLVGRQKRFQFPRKVRFCIMTGMSVDILAEWKSRPCVLATMHGKERVLAPLMREHLGVEVVVPTDFNTDRFGTFTREVVRAGDQLEAARAKVLAALAHTGADLGLASEGSFGVHPALPLTASNYEIVILIDLRHNLEIVGHYRTSSLFARGQSVTTPEEAVAAARSWGFPEQGVILRLSETSSRSLHKELTTEEALLEASRTLLSRWFVRSVFIETDMRAHRCPARLASIKEATHDLIANCQRLCPRCVTPGFVVCEVVRGLPCEACGYPTDRVKELVSVCQKCQYTKIVPGEAGVVADPGDCSICNP